MYYVSQKNKSFSCNAERNAQEHNIYVSGATGTGAPIAAHGWHYETVAIWMPEGASNEGV